ncbi:MAG: hypothetical protein IKR61_07860 [Lachnospiraceae bacterium]|nr:hypothetical protein [Lachnospiraceae bacterium]
MNKYRQGLKMLPLAKQFKLNMFCALIFGALGLTALILAASVRDMTFTGFGILYLAMVPMFVAQMSHQMVASEMIGSSVYRYFYDVELPNFLMITGNAFIFLLTAVRALFMSEKAFAAELILMEAVCIFMLTIYSSVVYKCYGAAVVLVVLMMLGYFGFINGNGMGDFIATLADLMSKRISLGGIFVASLFLMVLADVLHVLITRALTRRTLSPMIIRQVMKT